MLTSSFKYIKAFRRLLKIDDTKIWILNFATHAIAWMSDPDGLNARDHAPSASAPIQLPKRWHAFDEQERTTVLHCVSQEQSIRQNPELRERFFQEEHVILSPSALGLICVRCPAWGTRRSCSAVRNHKYSSKSSTKLLWGLQWAYSVMLARVLRANSAQNCSPNPGASWHQHLPLQCSSACS